MGYREDVAIAYSPEGWNQFLSALKSLSDDQRAPIVELIEGADEAQINEDGEFLIRWSYVKTYCDDFKAYLDLHSQVSCDEYYGVFLGEDGAQETRGSYCDTPYNLGFNYSINTNDIGDFVDCKSLIDVEMNAKNPAKSPIVIPAVDDHQCISCGNDRCSKTEKSCWKCGHPIS